MKSRLRLRDYRYRDTHITIFTIPHVLDSKLLYARLCNLSLTFYMVINSFILCFLYIYKNRFLALGISHLTNFCWSSPSSPPPFSTQLVNAQ